MQTSANFQVYALIPKILLHSDCNYDLYKEMSALVTFSLYYFSFLYCSLWSDVVDAHKHIRAITMPNIPLHTRTQQTRTRARETETERDKKSTT